MLVGHVRAHARRRPRPPARRRSAPPRPAPRGVRLLHRGRGPCSGRRWSCSRPPQALRDYPAVIVDADGGRADRSRSSTPRARRRGSVGGARRGRRAPRGLRAGRRVDRQAGGRPRRAVTVRDSTECRARPYGLGSHAVQVVTDLSSSPWPDERSVLTIGAYDGVHLGHQAIIDAVRRRADGLGARSVVRHVRSPPGLDRPPGVGASAVDRSRAEARAPRRDRRRRDGRDHVRPDAVRGAARRRSSSV